MNRKSRKSGKTGRGIKESDHGTNERRSHNLTRLEAVDVGTNSTRLRVLDGTELDRLLYTGLISSDQHWAGSKLEQAVVQAGGIKGCLANVERTSGGGGGEDRKVGAIWRVARAVRSVEQREGKKASRLLLDLAMNLVSGIPQGQLPRLRLCLDALAYHYGLGRWESFSLLRPRLPAIASDADDA